MQRGQSAPQPVPPTGLRMFETAMPGVPSSSGDDATPSTPDESSSVSVEFEVENTYVICEADRFHTTKNE